MNAPVRTSNVVPPDDDGFDLTLEIWVARLVTLSALFLESKLGLIAAVDRAWAAAEEAGLVEAYGIDEIQAAMALAFGCGR